MARRAARVDDNQSEVTAALREAGATVAFTHMVGMGFPDIVVGFRNKNYLMEIKDGNKAPSAQKLTEMEKRWHQTWNGSVVTVSSPEAALAVIGVYQNRGRIS